MHREKHTKNIEEWVREREHLLFFYSFFSFDFYRFYSTRALNIPVVSINASSHVHDSFSQKISDHWLEWGNHSSNALFLCLILTPYRISISMNQSYLHKIRRITWDHWSDARIYFLYGTNELSWFIVKIWTELMTMQIIQIILINKILNANRHAM